ncbi:MAG: hypothetical protein N2036_10610 [Bryobacteraceae bacterium]|nr:hypothetical protein [Bryobacteraceae bacterium]MCX7604512.1 hypothetical protein [Bryobacteraceae bacterium]
MLLPLLIAAAALSDQTAAPSCALAQWAMGRAARPEVLDVAVMQVEERAAGPARLAWQDPDGEIWLRPLDDGETAILLVNRTGRPVSLDVIWKELGLGGTRATLRVFDVLRRRNLGKVHGGFAHRLEPGACALFRVEK